LKILRTFSDVEKKRKEKKRKEKKRKEKKRKEKKRKEKSVLQQCNRAVVTVGLSTSSVYDGAMTLAITTLSKRAKL
jgi:hypothetical protein